MSACRNALHPGTTRRLALDVDALVESSLVLVWREADGELVGTGFLLGPRLLLTCDHVAAPGLVAVCGMRRARLGETIRHPDFDLALVHLSRPLGPPLAAAALETLPPLLRGRGAAKTVTGYVDSSPFQLQLVGRARVRYRGDGVKLDSGVDLEGSGVRPGASGSPLVGDAERAAVAVIVGGNANLDINRVWAVPLDAAAADWPELAQALRENDAALARYGLALNAKGADALFALASARHRQVLANQERFEARFDVPRTDLLRQLERFVCTDRPVLAIVGASNVGKSWALAAWATQAVSGELRLLVEVRTLPLDAPPILKLVNDALQTALAERFPRPEVNLLLPSLPLLSKALRDSGLRLTVVVDGLNEAPDVHRFAKHWLPEAVAWCTQQGVRLVLSCREESWPIVANVARLTASQCFSPNADSADDGPLSWCLRLGEYSGDEAALAAERYGNSAYGSLHPLMYRIMRALDEHGTNDIGRLRMLNRYLDLQLAHVAAAARLGTSQLRTLKKNLREIADALPLSGQGGVPREQSQNTIDDALLHVLIDEGILSFTGDREHMRFRHDPLADVLRTIDPLPLHAFIEPRRVSSSMSVPRIAAASMVLLRLESDEREADYREGLAMLLEGLSSRRYRMVDLAEGAERVARALPRRRVDDIRAIYTAIMQHASDWHDVARCVEEARLPPDERANLLLLLASKERGDGYPLRHKDWQVPSHCKPFEYELQRQTPAGAIFRLLASHRQEVFPIVRDGLSDGRPVGSEASIATLCAGVLCFDAKKHFNEVMDAVISIDPAAGVRLLGDRLIGEYGEAAVAKVLEAVDAGNEGPIVIRLLCNLSTLSHEERLPRIRRLFDRLRGLPDRLASTILLASELRRCQPQELDSWDLMCENWCWSYNIGTLPTARLERAVALIEERGAEFGRFVLRDHLGSRDEQWALIRALLRGLTTEHHYAFRSLVEIKLDKLDEPEYRQLQRPWLALGQALVRGDRGRGIRENLVFRAFSSAGGRQHWTNRMRRVALDFPHSDERPDIVQQLMRSDSPERLWCAWYRRALLKDPNTVDRLAWLSLEELEELPVEDRCKRARRLVTCWRSIESRTAFAAATLARLDVGKQPGKSSFLKR